MRSRGRPKRSNDSRKKQVRAAQAAFRERMREAGLWAVQTYLPATLVRKMDARKNRNESRGEYLVRVLGPLHGLPASRAN